MPYIYFGGDPWQPKDATWHPYDLQRSREGKDRDDDGLDDDDDDDDDD